MLKQCSCNNQCVHPDGPNLPATPEFFDRKTASKDGLASHCKACQKAKSKAYYEKNKEHIKKRVATYINENKDRQRQWEAQWRERNREKERERLRSYAFENSDKVRATKHRSAAKRRAVKNAREREKRKLNPQVRIVPEQRRRARKKGLPRDFTQQDWENAKQWFGNKCAYCDADGDNLTADHLIPLSSSECPGTVKSNMVPACRSCNASKHKRDLRDWLHVRFTSAEAEIKLKRIAEYQEWIASIN